MFMFISTVLSAPTEMYFEFDDRATSVSTSAGQNFCNAATSVLTPAYVNNTLWCLVPGNFKYAQYVQHGRLSNTRIWLPEKTELAYDSVAVRSQLSQALLDEGFFLSAANVTFVVDWKRDMDLNVGLTTATFIMLLLASVLTRQCS